MGTTIFPNISADDYHFGESLLGWWSYMQGAIPYIDYIPAHGVIGDDLTQFLSFVFYDGSAGSIIHVGNLSIALLSLPPSCRSTIFRAVSGWRLPPSSS